MKYANRSNSNKKNNDIGFTGCDLLSSLSNAKYTFEISVEFICRCSGACVVKLKWYRRHHRLLLMPFFPSLSRRYRSAFISINCHSLNLLISFSLGLFSTASMSVCARHNQTSANPFDDDCCCVSVCCLFFRISRFDTSRGAVDCVAARNCFRSFFVRHFFFGSVEWTHGATIGKYSKWKLEEFLHRDFMRDTQMQFCEVASQRKWMLLLSLFFCFIFSQLITRCTNVMARHQIEMKKIVWQERRENDVCAMRYDSIVEFEYKRSEKRQ